ncbi:MAG: transposase, partial [Erysipelotrichaceae bacterium]|nr:transposase [Erysipelotrichaceae bacterium]
MGRPKGGKNRKYTYEFKLKAVEAYLNEHRSFGSIAAFNLNSYVYFLFLPPLGLPMILPLLFH